MNESLFDVFVPRIPRRRVESPIFVVGCCNSGTTILWNALKDHYSLDGPETEGQDSQDLPLALKHFLGKQTSRMFAHPMFGGAYERIETDYTDYDAERIDAVYAEHVTSSKRLVEKSPANSVRTRYLQSIFPDARFIIIVRNGYAVSEGIVRKRSYDPDRPHLAGLDTDIQDAASQWYNANRVLLRDMRHLRKPFLIRYEDLVSDAQSTLRSVFRFCELESPMSTRPVVRSNDNERQVARLSSRDLEMIDDGAGCLLRRLGYHHDKRKEENSAT